MLSNRPSNSKRGVSSLKQTLTASQTSLHPFTVNSDNKSSQKVIAETDVKARQPKREDAFARTYGLD